MEALRGLEKRTQGSSARVAASAAAQHGVIHRHQAIAIGVSAKAIRVRLESGQWVAVGPAVYRMAGAPTTWHQRLMAACLVGGDGTVASHRSAGWLWGFDGVGPGSIELTVPGLGERRVKGATVHRTRSLGLADVGVCDGIPVTRPARTLVDLAGVLDRPGLEAALDSALREGRVSVGHLGRRLDAVGSRGRPGMSALRSLLVERGEEGPHGSVREAELAVLLDGSGFPPLVRQYELLDGDGRFVARFDFADPPSRVAIEFESYRHHFGRQAWRRDQARHNHATALGWLVLHATEDDLRGQQREAFRQTVDAARLRRMDRG